MQFIILVTILSTFDPFLVSYQTGTITPRFDQEYDYISIAGYRFNPREQLPEIPTELSGKSDYYLVHLKGPVYDDMKATIESYGVKLLTYVPFNAFIARLDETKKAIIEALPFVNWVGSYEPAYKLSSSIAEHPEMNEMLVQLFYDEDEYLIKNQLVDLGCEILEIATDQYVKLIKVSVDHAKIPQMAQIPGVMHIEPYFQPVHCNQGTQWVVQTWQQTNRRLWNKGIRGRGQVVSTVDSGILTSHNMFRDPAVTISTWGDFPTHRKIIGYRQPSGSSSAFGDVAGAMWHGTHTAGTICGDDSYVSGVSPNDGMGIQSKMYHMDIGTATGSLSVPATLSNIFSTAYAGNAGGAARVSSNSWGTTGSYGDYSSYSSQTDQYMWNNRDMLVVFAAGNDGPSPNTVGAPGTAKSIVTAGSVNPGMSANIVSDFSSRGPCDDNRLKPTISAPGGAFIWSSAGPNNNSYLGMAGTSMATPAMGGCAAMVREYFARGFYPTGDSVPGNVWAFIPASVVKAVMLNSALPDISGSTIPDNNTGWGRVCLDEALYFTGDARDLVVYYDSVSTGQYDEWTVAVNDSSQPIKITVCYTDYYGAASQNPAINNNLDLLVTTPTATQYLGNVYSGGQSTTGGTADNLNVEENVRRNVPEIGSWTVRVTGTNVPSGSRQPYAVVITGGLGAAATPSLHIVGDRIYDPPPANWNGRCDAGETVYLTDTLKNSSAVGVTACTGVLREASTYITLVDSIGTFGDIAVGALSNNGSDQFSFSISAATPAGTTIPFGIHLTGGASYVQDLTFDIVVGQTEPYIIWGPKQVTVTPGDTHFLYGAAYNPINNQVYVTNAYETKIPYYSSDSFATYLGYINAPDTLASDIKYCAYDNTFWVAADWATNPPAGQRVFKISTTGTVLRSFNNPATDYPTGLAWLETQRYLYLADRRSAAGNPSLIYRSDTLGAVGATLTLSLGDNYGARGMASDPYGTDTTLLLVYTHFSSDATPVLIATRLYELRRSDGAALNQLTLPGWNVRGVEYDPRDGNYWLTIAQNPDRALVKILGFHGIPGVSVNEAKVPVPMERIMLSPGMPTPFTHRVRINYSLPVTMKVRLSMYDAAGRLVKTFVDGVVEPGIRTIEWNGTTYDDNTVSSGVYFCYLETEHGSLVSKIVYTR